MSETNRPPDGGRTTVQTSVALRAEAGFFFGMVRSVDDRRVLVEVDAPLVEGEPLDVRVTLSPTQMTALFKGRVARVLATAAGETPRFLLDIGAFATGDREKFDAWIQNVRNRGTFASFDSALSGFSSAAGGGASSEVRQALQRMAGRPLSAGPTTDPFGARSDIESGNVAGGGRNAVRDALRAALARRSDGSAPPSTPTAPPPVGRVVASGPAAPPTSVAPRSSPPPSTPSGVSRAPTPSTPSGVSRATPSTPPGAADPAYATTLTRTATWMEVHWRDPALFERDARLQLANQILVLARGPSPLPTTGALRLVLRHQDVQLDCEATVRATGADGVTYRLQLDALQLERVRGWVAAYGRK